MGVAYRENVDYVMAVLREIGQDLERDPAFASRVLEPLEVLGVDDFAESAVVIKIRIKAVPLEQWNVGRELRRRIKNRFDELGIEIPFPHVSLYVGRESGPFNVVGGQPESGVASGSSVLPPESRTQAPRTIEAMSG